MSVHPGNNRPLSDPDDEPRPRRLRGLLKIGLLALAALVLLVAFAPTLLSTGIARAYILDYASRSLGIRLAADDLDLSWIGGQSITGLSIESPDGKPAAKFGRLSVQRGLLNLMMDSTRLGDVVVSEGEVWPEELLRLRPAEKPPTEAAKPPAPETPGPHKRTFSARLGPPLEPHDPLRERVAPHQPGRLHGPRRHVQGTHRGGRRERG